MTNNAVTEFRAHEVLRDGREYSCHSVDERGSWEFSPHRHVDCCDLTYVEHGILVQHADGVEREIRPGQMTLVRPGDLHRVRGRDLLMYNLNFRDESLRLAGAYLGLGRWVDELLQRETAPVFRVAAANRASTLIGYQDLLVNQHGAGARRLFRAFLVRWLLEVAGERGPERETVQPSWLADLLFYIEDHVETPVSVADLVTVSGRSAEHVARTFRAHLNTTPSAAINRARLARAAVLLAHTNRPILDICYGLGYNSPSYFYRLFRRAHGVPPRQYRDEHTVLPVPSAPPDDRATSDGAGSTPNRGRGREAPQRSRSRSRGS